MLICLVGKLFDAFFVTVPLVLVIEISKNKKKKTSKIYNQLTRSKPNSIKNQPIKTSNFPAVAQKRVTKARDVPMKTAHLGFFSSGKKN